jgi:hypothetical protein
LAVLILAVTAVGFAWRPNYDKAHERQPVQTAEQDREQTDREIAKYTFWLALGTGVLAFSTVGLWIETRRSGSRQSREIWQSLRISQKTANAAMKSAEVAEASITTLERPYMYVFGVSKFTDREFQPREGLIGTEHEAGIEYRVANYGRTPAYIEEAHAEILVGEAREIITPAFATDDNPLVISPVIGPNLTVGPIFHPSWNAAHLDYPEGFGPIDFTEYAGDDDDREWRPKLGPDERLYFRVLIKYRGPFAGGYETSACWTWDSGFGVFELSGKKYNYEK